MENSFKKKAEAMAKARIESMSQNEIVEIANKEKKKHKILDITLIILIILMLALIVPAFIFLDGLAVGIMYSCFLIPCIAFVVYDILASRKKDTYAWAFSRLVYEYIGKPSLVQVEIDKDIIRVTILDSYTEVTDKLHAVLNYQEFIQTRYYKFKVDYKDGHTDIITEKEGSEICIRLMSLVGTDENKSLEQKQNKTEEIRKFKKLLDDGIITEEEFEKKKKQLLDID